MADEFEEVEIDPDHPWVDASLHGRPSPVPVNVKVEPVELTQQTPDGPKSADAILMTVVSPVGAFTFFLPPAALHQMVMNGASILDALQQKASQGLIVADKGIEREVIRASKFGEGLKG